MKKFLSICLLFILPTTLSGCKFSFLGRTEMGKIEFIRAVGIDKVPDKKNTVRLTIATQSVRSGGGGLGQEKTSEILMSEGETVFDAVRNFWNFMDKRPFWGHLEYIVIGEETARDGLLKYIDFFCRDPEIGLTSKVFVARGMEARRIIEKGNSQDKFVFDRLEGLGENIWGKSIANTVDLIETMYILDNPFLSLYLPCVELAPFSKSGETNETRMDIVLGGFAIFKGDKMVFHLLSKEAVGLNWLRNKIKSSVIIVKSPEGENISLEVIDSNIKLKPVIVDGELSITVDVNVSSNIAEIRSSENIFTEKSLEALEKKQVEIIKNNIESTIEKAQDNEMDFFGTAVAVFHKYPIRWEDNYKDDWEKTFSDISFDVRIASRILRTYNIKEPTRYQAGEEK